MYTINLNKQKLVKRRTAKSNNQKEYEERKSKLFNLGTSPMNSIKVSGGKTRVNSINQPNAAMRKIDMSMIKSFKVVAKTGKSSNQGRKEGKHSANFEVAKSHPFKLSRKTTSKSKYSDRRSLSGSNKTGRPTSNPAQKKKLKTIKGKQLESKDNGGYFCIPQFPNNMHAAKALVEFKKQLKKSSGGE